MGMHNISPGIAVLAMCVLSTCITVYVGVGSDLSGRGRGSKKGAYIHK